MAMASTIYYCCTTEHQNMAIIFCSTFKTELAARRAKVWQFPCYFLY